MQVKAPELKIECHITLPGSKSISNRIVLLNHTLNVTSEASNLSNSDDTKLLQNALKQIKNSTSAELDLHHSGADIRFLAALLSATPGEWTLTGSERLKQRPIGILVSALKQLGANISYLDSIGFPPIKIVGQKLRGGTLEVDASVSSQFISALLLLVPLLDAPLQLHLVGKSVSTSYVQLTIEILKDFQIEVIKTENSLTVVTDTLKIPQKPYLVESDWSAASYWYSICALSKGASIELSFLNKNSHQGDAVLAQIYEKFGVYTSYSTNSVLIHNTGSQAESFEFDFTNCPDIAQTVAVTCVGLRINATLNGLQTLKIKETDRITALKNELEKCDVLVTTSENSLQITCKQKPQRNKTLSIETYNDHRMALSFAPLAMCFPNITILNPEVVSKSYPNFWMDLITAGFSVNLHP